MTAVTRRGQQGRERNYPLMKENTESRSTEGVQHGNASSKEKQKKLESMCSQYDQGAGA